MKEQKKVPDRLNQRIKLGEPIILIRPPFDFSSEKYRLAKHLENTYPELAPGDLRLAETFRLALARGERKLNPLQAKVGKRGHVWIDVLLERAKGVKMRELREIMQVHGKPGRSRFVSGRVKAERLQKLTKRALRIQTARPVVPTLNYSVPAISASQKILRDKGFGDINGTGVIVGIVDRGCDFNHPNFKKDGQTRLLYLWDQNGTAGHPPQSYSDGTEYKRDQINRALNTQHPYADLGYTPDRDAHGTHVMDIAAGGSPIETEFMGVAPGADLIFVHLMEPITSQEIKEKELGTLGSSTKLIEAVNYIFEKAYEEKKPAVVNISLGCSGGGHNGTSMLESNFDTLLAPNAPKSKYGRAIVIAAGNDYRHQLHAKGTVSKTSSTTLYWYIPSQVGDPSFDLRQELEIWYPKGAALKVEVLDEDGHPMDLLCPFNDQWISKEVNAVPIWTILNTSGDPAMDTEDNHIDILVDNHNPAFKSGTWQVQLSQDLSQPSNNTNIKFHAWIESTQQSDLDEKTYVHFSKGSNQTSSINGIANARLPIVVGSCIYDKNEHPPFLVSGFTSAGPSLNQSCPNKPELHAPGEMISSARAIDGDRTDEGGTSMAAPHVTGVIALMFQKALGLTPSKVLSMEEIRNILIKSPSDKHEYEPQLGYGCVNAMNALKQIH